MATQSPFSFVSNLVAGISKSITLPPWLVEEVQRRMVLLVNHVLQQEPEAQNRLAAQQGKAVFISWRQFHAQLRVTPAGLFDLDGSGNPSDLLLEVAEPSVTKLAQNAIHSTRPPIRIAGDVELAGALNWVIDNVRWDLEEDLARLIGDVPAHKIAQVARKLAEELRKFVQAAASTLGSLAPQTRTQRAATGPSAAAPVAPTTPSAAPAAPHATADHGPSGDVAGTAGAAAPVAPPSSGSPSQQP